MAEIGNRKVFFLHPQAVIQDDLVRALLEDNYEVYLVRNPVSAKTVVREFPDSILLIQIDSGLEEDRWISFAEELKAIPRLADLTLCILSIQNSESIEKSFLKPGSPFSHGISYGNFDFVKTLADLKVFLADEKARLPKNQVHGISPESHEVSVVFARDGERYSGTLRDITVSGLTCKLGQVALLPSEIPIPVITITYGNTQFTVAGRIAGKHGRDDALHLILFDDGSRIEKRKEIYDLLQTCFQAELDDTIAAKGHKRQVVTKVPRSSLYRRKSP